MHGSVIQIMAQQAFQAKKNGTSNSTNVPKAKYECDKQHRQEQQRLDGRRLGNTKMVICRLEA